ncbi:hypothetical protein Ddye_015263 [Dipteronia dyeriana]|uniref:Uncharacterized protein n=1 Tax=Dipteronia dyeriana TaxID=168575 RepID=A0AAD9WXQ4_9ROSI|nr:hypothetical protein Ddye_015263 [Dipteronia dyeriana]
MKVPVGFFQVLWSFVSFLPCFFLLFTLGLLKGAIVGPVVVGIIVISNSAVITGLWPAHFTWTFYCVLRYAVCFTVFECSVYVCLIVNLKSCVVLCYYLFCFLGL